MIGIGTILNALGILFGGILGLTLKKPLSSAQQVAVKGLLGVFTVYIGLKTTVLSISNGKGGILKQIGILLLALILGRITGRLLHLQKLSNRLGRYAKEKFAASSAVAPARFADGFLTCALLYCVAPISVLGAILEGLQNQWQTLAIKAVIDGMATMAFAMAFGWSVVLSIIPVIAYQGTITLCCRLIVPFLEDHHLLEAVTATAGLLVFCVALVILEFKKVELADYLPGLLFSPLLTWWLG